MRLALSTIALSLTLAGSALAADYQGSVGASNPTFGWDGGPGTSLGANLPGVGGASVGNFVGCFDGIADCEETLIKVETAGKLTVTTDSADDANDTIDLYLWPSDAAGAYDDSGADLGDGTGAGTTGDEKISVQVNPGFYVAQIKFFLADGDTYKGSAVLSGFAAAPAAAAAVPAVVTPSTSTPAASTQPAPASQPAAVKKKPSKRAACTKKAKKIKNKRKRAKALKKCKKIKG